MTGARADLATVSQDEILFHAVGEIHPNK